MTNPLKFLIIFIILSLIFVEVHSWGWYNYSEATVYTNYLDEPVQNPGGKWTDFCDNDGTCYGIFCDANKYLNKAWKCVDSESFTSLSSSINDGFVYFHDNSPNYTITTKSQEYLKELKIRVNRHDPSVYIRGLEEIALFSYGLYSLYQVPFQFESDTMLFLVRRDNSSKLQLIDYQCSLVDTRLKFMNYTVDTSGFNTTKGIEMSWLFTLLSAICLFLVAIFYARIPELRHNMVGKLVSVLAIVEAIRLITIHVSSDNVAEFLNDVFDNYMTLWFLAMVYETFVLLKYFL
jgi:hypothetical protein